MAVTLADINNRINDMRRDNGSASVDMTAEGFRAINATLQVWQQMHDWEFSIEEQTLNYHSGIDRYTLASNFKAPLGMKYYKGSQRDPFALVSDTNFNQTNERLKPLRYAISTTAQGQTLRLKAVGTKSVINAASAYNNTGTWVGASGVTNVATDSYEYFDLGSSVSFDSSSMTAGTLTNSTFTAIDLSRFQNRSAVYFNIYFATVTNLSSISLKWGTDVSNYWTYTSTSDYLGNAFVANLWTRIKSPWNSATKVGTPTITSIKYLQVTLNYGGSTTSTGFRIENFFVSEDTPVTFTYYSLNMVKAASGGAKTMIFSNSGNATDTPLWSGTWDYVNEAFANSVLEYIFWMTGEYDDLGTALKHIQPIVDNLKRRLPSRRKYAELTIIDN